MVFMTWYPGLFSYLCAHTLDLFWILYGHFHCLFSPSNIPYQAITLSYHPDLSSHSILSLVAACILYLLHISIMVPKCFIAFTSLVCLSLLSCSLKQRKRFMTYLIYLIQCLTHIFNERIKSASCSKASNCVHSTQNKNQSPLHSHRVPTSFPMFLFSHSARAKIVFWLFLDALSTFTFRAFDLMLLQSRIYLWIGFKASVNVFLPDISMASLIQFFTQELSSWRPLLTTLSKITFILTYLFCSSQHLSNIMCLLLVYCLFLLPECSF